MTPRAHSGTRVDVAFSASQRAEMAATTPNYPGPRRWWPSDVVVTRHVRVPFATLVRRFCDAEAAARDLSLPDAELSIVDRPQLAPDTTTWRARGKLNGSRRQLVPFPPVEIEINAWSASTSELRIVPLTRLARLWGVHRALRYTEVASIVADCLISLCSVSTTPLVTCPSCSEPKIGRL
jgi:hypothetical protein